MSRGHGSPTVLEGKEAASRSGRRTLDLKELWVPCFECGEEMRLPLASVLAAAPMWCVHCGVKFSVNHDVSRPALEALRRAADVLGEQPGIE